MGYTNGNRVRAFILQNYKEKTSREMAEELGCHRVNIIIHLRELGIKAKSAKVGRPRIEEEVKPIMIRPKAEYTNTSPYGVAHEYLMEQLRLERACRL